MLLYQLVNFLEADTNEVPSSKACTDLLLKSRVPGEKLKKEAVV